MALTSTQKQTILEQIKKKEAQLEIANASLEELLANPVEDYRLDTAEGTQRAKRRSLREIQEIIQSLEAEILQLWAKLRCAGLTSIRLRRKYGFPRRYRTY
jgi:vacuolar-type H+-ATPase subunit H